MARPGRSPCPLNYSRWRRQRARPGSKRKIAEPRAEYDIKRFRSASLVQNSKHVLGHDFHDRGIWPPLAKGSRSKWPHVSWTQRAESKFGAHLSWKSFFDALYLFLSLAKGGPSVTLFFLGYSFLRWMGASRIFFVRYLQVFIQGKDIFFSRIPSWLIAA